jgi:hypothetical protein
VKALLYTFAANTPNLATGECSSPEQYLKAIIDLAVFAEDAGFAAFGVGRASRGAVPPRSASSDPGTTNRRSTSCSDGSGARRTSIGAANSGHRSTS